MRQLVLASGSVYRRKLLKKLRLEFITCSSQVDETPLPDEIPAALALRLSIAKAQAISTAYPEHLIIGSDQVAALDKQLLGKPGNFERAVQQLTAQSGKKVTFYTGLCVLDSASNRYLTDIDICNVYFKKLDIEQIRRYLNTDEPFDCAGSFKSEEYGISLFEKIDGDDPNALIGLPLIKLIGLLNRFGWTLP